MSLHDTLARAAGPDGAGFDHHDVERRVATRRRTRRRARLAAGVGAVLLAGVAAASVVRAGTDDAVVSTGPTASAADRELVTAIVGTWDLRGVSIVADIDVDVVLQLLPDGTMAGTTPCGSFWADDWTVAGGRLTVSGLQTDGHRCAPDPGRVESLLLEVLDGRPEVSRWVDDGVAEVSGPPEDWTTLQLTASDGAFVSFDRTERRPAISGELADGRRWIVTDRSEDLCASVDLVNVGCEEADAAHPRVVGTGGATLLVGRLPEGATSVFLEHDDGRPADLPGAVVAPEVGLWAVPVAPDDVADIVRYTDAEGRQISVASVDD